MARTKQSASKISETNLKKWTLLERHPLRYNTQIPIIINNNEFVCGIYQYNITSNKWKPWGLNPDNITNVKILAYNHTHKLIYIWDILENMQQIIIMSINYNNTNDIKLIKLMTNNDNDLIGQHINGKLHIIDKINEQHWIYDENTQSWNDEKLQNVSDHVIGLVYVSSKQRILLVDPPLNLIHSYCMITNKWSDIHMELPYELRDFGVSLTTDERYIIITGGKQKMNFEHIPRQNYRNNFFWTQNIYLIDLKEMKLLKSDMVIPKCTGCNSIIVNDKRKDELVVYGFIRQCWNEYDIGLDNLPPKYIVKLIGLRYCIQYLHVLEYYGGQSHWRISIDDIVKT
eukprot:486699_1